MLSENVLAEIRSEIAGREAELEQLRELERLAAPLTGQRQAPAPQPRLPAPKPIPRDGGRMRSAPSAPRPRGDGARTSERKQRMLAALSTRGPLSLSAIGEAIGEARSNLALPMRELVAEGRVAKQGAAANTTYDVARNGDKSGRLDPPANGTNGDAPALSPRVRKLEAAPNGNGEVELEDQVLDVVRKVGGRVAISEIEHQLRRRHGGCDRGQLEQAVRRLTTHGLAVRDPGGGLRLADVVPEGERPLEDVVADVAGVDSL